PNGQWAASVKPIKCGAVYTAREYDAFGQASARSAVFRAPACAPVITKVTTKAILGKGTPGNTVRVYNGKGKLVGTAKVKANGTWVLNVRSGTCGARYHAVQFNAQGVASKWSNIKVAPTRGCKASRPIVPGTPDTGMRRAM
ncbi:MAG TPA: Ig-like domain-containing protein, partial [Marmoricola sp.]|nr:Ig-like domain-containing protein [Marmoricola sp.]